MIRSLLAGAIDYAGLFPPAGLAMRDAVRNYLAYRQGPDAWALGRFVVQAGQLEELAEEALTSPRQRGAGADPWRISALIGRDDAGEMDLVRAFNARYGSGAAGRQAGIVDMVEARGEGAADVEVLAQQRDTAPRMFVEVDAGAAGRPVLMAVAACGLAAKIRTGGVRADHFPSPMDVAVFIDECARLRVPFKATAGLHHPIRADYRLTYEAESERSTMFGFLNVITAAAAARAGSAVDELVEILDDRDPAAFGLLRASVTWRQLAFSPADIEAVRSSVALSFGSCSFEEPLSELRALGLL